MSGSPSKKKPAPKKKRPTKKKATKRKSTRNPAIAGKRGGSHNRPLTIRQALFVEHYVSAAVHFNGTEAARRAGYSGGDSALAKQAFENLRNPKLVDLIAKKKAEALKGAGVSVEAILWDLQVIRAKALEDGKFAPAVRCTELLGKYMKMFTDRIEHTLPVEDMTDDQLLELIQEVGAQAGVDIGGILSGRGAEGGTGDPVKGTTATN